MSNTCTYNLLIWKWIDEKFECMYLLCFIYVDTVFLFCLCHHDGYYIDAKSDLSVLRLKKLHFPKISEQASLTVTEPSFTKGSGCYNLGGFRSAEVQYVK